MITLQEVINVVMTEILERQRLEKENAVLKEKIVELTKIVRLPDKKIEKES